MSCWVVPTVAAELWGMSVEDVLGLIDEGRVPSKKDYHFLLVDVAPDSPTMVATREEHPGRAAQAPAAPPAPDLAAVLSHDEWAALSQPAAEDDATGDYDGEPAPNVRPGELALAEAAGGECSWVRVRQRVARRRLRPAA